MRHGESSETIEQGELEDIDKARHCGGPGEYGYIFDDLPLWQGLGVNTETILRRLANSMRDYNDDSDVDDNEKIPAGYTYLGQFIVHDITFSTRKSIGPGNIHENARTPALDLDSLYGGGPDVSPILYQRSEDPGDDYRFLLRTGRLSEEGLLGCEPSLIAGGCPADLPRVTETSKGILGPDAVRCADPLIADMRNDDHLIVSQLHLLFSHFHNRVAGVLKERHLSNRQAFRRARDYVTACYQEIVVQDFLKRVLMEEVHDDLISSTPEFCLPPPNTPLKQHQLPFEFSLAAGRFGHAMARGFYDINCRTQGNLQKILGFSSFKPESLNSLPLRDEWVVDWRNFFDIAKKPPKASRRITPFLSSHLHSFHPPFAGADSSKGLVWFDLLRSLRPGLPSGQDLARRLERHVNGSLEVQILKGGDLVPKHETTKQPISVENIRRTFEAHPEFYEESPLFYYILQEANLLFDGLHLGPVGSFVVGLTFRRILDAGRSRQRSQINSMPNLLDLMQKKDFAFKCALEEGGI